MTVPPLPTSIPGWRSFTIKGFIKKHRYDLILILGILLASIVSITLVHFLVPNDNLVAAVYKENSLLMEIDLAKETDERDLTIEGTQTEMVISVKKDAIRVKKSGCPHQDCVDMGWVTTTNRPIACVYNAVYITLKGVNAVNDVEAG